MTMYLKKCSRFLLHHMNFCNKNMNMITLFEVRLQPQNRLGTAASKYDTKHLGKNSDKQSGCIFARSSLRQYRAHYL